MEMAIGRVAEIAGVRTSTLRYYESVGLLHSPRRVSGQRRYKSDILLNLACIKISQQAGFTIAEIKQLLHGFPRAVKPSERWEKLARKKLVEVENLLRRARIMKRLLKDGIRCRCASLQECTLILSWPPEAEGVEDQS